MQPFASSPMFGPGAAPPGSPCAGPGSPYPGQSPGQQLGSSSPPAPASPSLRASIAERFTGAYEAQLGYLAHVAAVEQRQLQSRNDALRNSAYLAQRNAAENRVQTEALRNALGQGHVQCSHMREAVHRLRNEIAAEAAAVQACDAAVLREEAAHAELEARLRDECAELTARVGAAQQTRRCSEERAAALAQELAAAREEQASEVQTAQQEQERARMAEAARAQALGRLRNHEETAIQALQRGVAQLEADFAVERADYAERARKATAKVQEMEAELDLRRRPRLEAFFRPGALPLRS